MYIKLIASAAAALFTLTSIHAVTSNLPQPTTRSTATSTTVVTLAPVEVYADAADLRAAALLVGVDAAPGQITTSAAEDASAPSDGQVRLLRSAAAMPYYSFGDTLGRINRK